ncbi:LytTR family DNA-binding domain-containing protein [uncultured Clostridium sp.]|uniref:LytR/AlgR family response regulator transcription factor n=1 Tax=uncultured Clostridium sp. TaxID=59620 RepID=UPI0025E8BB14|nr:LytTR family DNA-binding domain-containing protein [uncultured Clostridium sp.]
MFNICICDTNTDFLSKLDTKIIKIAKYNNIKINTIKYSSSKKLLFDIYDLKDSIDIYFLDVLLGDLNGIYIANEIRKFNTNAKIIFITSNKHYVFDALDVMPLHYLIKQELSNKKLERIFIKAINLIKTKKKNLFLYKKGHKIKCIDKNEIIFFEIKNRIINMTCTNGNTEKFYSTMKNLVETIKSDNFIQIHRSFLINTYFLKSIENKHLTLKNNIILPIGEKYIKNLKLKYNTFN